jgi:hypothetical protein
MLNLRTVTSSRTGRAPFSLAATLFAIASFSLGASALRTKAFASALLTASPSCG